MNILKLLGLGNRKKDVNNNSSIHNLPAQKELKEKIPTAVQDSCCGSCGGQGHIKIKEPHS